MEDKHPSIRHPGNRNRWLGPGLETSLETRLFRVVGNDHFCDTTKRASQRLTPHIQGEIPLYHRSGLKPLDPATLGLETLLEGRESIEKRSLWESAIESVSLRLWSAVAQSSLSTPKRAP